MKQHIKNKKKFYVINCTNQFPSWHFGTSYVVVNKGGNKDTTRSTHKGLSNKSNMTHNEFNAMS